MPRLFPPIPTIPTITTQASVKNGRTWRRLPSLECVLGRASPLVPSVRSAVPTRGRDCVPEFGPVVAIVKVTAVVPAPAAIDVGLNPQLVNAGRFTHPKLTAEEKTVPPTGLAENVYLALCPARTATDALPVSVHVKSGADLVTV